MEDYGEKGEGKKDEKGDLATQTHRHPSNCYGKMCSAFREFKTEPFYYNFTHNCGSYNLLHFPFLQIAKRENLLEKVLTTSELIYAACEKK